MKSPLERRIGVLRSQVRSLLAVHGLGWVLAGGVLTLLLAGLADWLFHFPREIRFLLLVAFVGFAGWLIAREIIAPLVLRFRDLDVALRIEERWPGLQDRLASTVQFMQMRKAGRDDEDIRGSRVLRDETIRQTLEDVESIDFREVVDSKPARLALATAAVPLALAGALFLLSPSSCRIALSRFFLPLGSAQWPKQTHLAVVDPPSESIKIARGQPFLLEVAVAQGEPLPETGEVTYRYDNGETVTRRLGTRSTDLASGAPDRLTDRLGEVARSFSYTVAAGDDSTAPRRVEVVPPPVLTHARVKLTPPPYTREPVTFLEPLGGKTNPGSEFDVQKVITGTLVEIQALSNKPLASAALAALGLPPWQSSQDETLPAAPPPAVNLQAGTQLATRFNVTSSGSFAFELHDTEGFHGQPRDLVRFNVVAIEDTPPQVAIDDPPANRDVTANAVVPIVIRADDDFGLQKVWINYRVAFETSAGVEQPPLVPWVTTPKDDPTLPDSERPRPVRSQIVRYDWDLAASELDLKPGTTITLSAAAADLDTIKGPKTGKSREIQLRILDPGQIQAQLDDQRRAIREEIARTLDMQRQASRPVEEAQRTLERVPTLREEDREAVRNAETIQRQVTDRVTEPADGLQRKVERYLEDQQNLRIDNPDARDQMERVLAGVERVRDQHLPPAEQSLARANRALDPSLQPNRPRQPEGTSAQPPETNPTSPQPKSEQQAPSTVSRNPADAKTAQQPPETNPSAAQSEAGQPSPETNPSPAQSKAGQSAPETNPSPTGQPPRDDASADPSSAPQELARAAQEQKAISDELQQMLDEMGEFENYRGLVQEAKNLLKEQREAIKAVEETSEKEALDGRSPEQLTPQQTADLDNLGARQQKLGEDIRQFENKLDEMTRSLETTDPLSSAATREAAQQSRERATAAKASEAGQQLSQNQMGRARDQQSQVEQDLKKLVDSLQNRRENELARLVKELKNIENQIAALRQQQAENRRQTAQAGQNPDQQERQAQLQKLAKEQKQIEEELKRQLQKLQKLTAQTGQRAGQRAAESMSRAAQQQERGEADEAEGEQEEALAGLEDVQEEVEDARRDAEEQLAMEQLSRIKDDLANLSKRQDELVVQTAEYEKAAESAPLSLAQKKSVVGLGRAQEAIQDETNDLVERLDAAPVFSLTLKRAAEAMGNASARLRKGDPGAETVAAQRLAARRYQQVLDSLKPDQGEGAVGGGGGGGGGGGQGGGDGIPGIAQLKMLKILQEEVNEQTESLDEIRERRKTLTDDQQTELARLKDEQKNVADLARDLTRPRRSDAEE